MTIPVLFAKLAGLYKTVTNLLEDPKHRYYDPDLVLEHFEQYAQIRDGLKTQLPELYSDLPTREIPKPVGGSPTNDRGYIERRHLERLSCDIEYLFEVRAHSRIGEAAVEERQARVFISHSSTDREVAEALTDLLEGALGLRPDQIRCTSVDGHRLPGGADTNEQLRLEIMEATSFVGIISQSSISSVYVLFELGARWGALLNMIPVLAPGTDHSFLKGPLSGLNALELGQRPQVQQLVSDLALELGLKTTRPEAYDKYIDPLVESASASSDAQPADVAQVTIANEYDDNDIISILENWLEKKAEDLFNIHYAQLDGELGLSRGSTKRLVRTASQRYFEVVREGQSSIRLQAKQFDAGYVEDDWDGEGTI